ncbi:DDE superfamily endonuclease [Popillia japonica]|uniref:DDE superfamily endonuclease n=1 Tax=Popillia japonica TaxID=7064 RepID=A0AAW1KP54_POPJA
MVTVPIAQIVTHFLPRKENGKVLLILDGHSSHCSDSNVLDFAVENGIILLCLPLHTTHYLQPLDQSLFKPLKTNWQKTITNWISSHIGRKVTRYQFRSLFCSTWNLAAIVRNGTSGFRACGVFPYDPQKMPEHAFKISNASKYCKMTLFGLKVLRNSNRYYLR